VKNQLTQEKLAEKLGISPNFLSNIENGKAWISPKTMAKLAVVFNIEPNELFLAETVEDPGRNRLLTDFTGKAKAGIESFMDDLLRRYAGE
jgi:transcriptional regulator with XRE-family HTH domain